MQGQRFLVTIRDGIKQGPCPNPTCEYPLIHTLINTPKDLVLKQDLFFYNKN